MRSPLNALRVNIDLLIVVILFQSLHNLVFIF